MRAFWQIHADAEQPLKAWFKAAEFADWSTPQANRVCFNVAGNKYRLIVKINYPYRIIYIRFIGTHGDYDRIDANKV